MDINNVAIVLGIIGTLTAIVVSIFYFKRKSNSVEFKIPQSSRKSDITISEGRISDNILVGQGNKINISNRNKISDKDLENLIQNIYVEDKKPSDKKSAKKGE